MKFIVSKEKEAEKAEKIHAAAVSPLIPGP
jgi:hypothetical protein